MNYSFIKDIDDELVLLSSEYGEQIFCKIVLRKNSHCIISDVDILIGNTAFRPLTNKYNRNHRINVDVMESLRNISREQS